MPYLKHTTTGEVFPMNEHLLKRGDFVEVDTIDAPLPSVEFEELKLDAVDKPKAERKPRARKVDPAPLLDDLDVPE